MTPEKEMQNDAIAKVDCNRAVKSCDNPDWRNQFGSKSCFCINCMRRCAKCEGDYLKE